MGEDKKHRHRSGRSRSTNRIIQSASGFAIAMTVLLIGGLAYASYAAYGGSVGTSLTPANGIASNGTAGGQNGQNSTAGGSAAGGSAGGGSAGGSSAAGSGEVQLVALGDSLTHGLGDASGQGYVGNVTAELRSSGYTVRQSNLGIDGLTSSGLAKDVAKPATQALLRSANLVLISIGGNDLNGAAGLPKINSTKIANARQQFQTNLKDVLGSIRNVNANATILLVGLYNPYGNIASSKQQTDAIVENWNADEQTVVANFPATVVVQTYDLFELNPTKYLYVDHFHPNQQGYQRIGDRVFQDAQAVLGG